MIETILIAVRDDDAAIIDEFVEISLAFAARGADVVLLYVSSPEAYEAFTLDSAPDVAATDDPQIGIELAQRNDVCQRIAERLAANGVDVEIQGRVSETQSSAVISVAEDAAIDHLVIGGQNRSPTGKAVFGDDSQRVLLNAACPVTFVRHQ